MPHRKFIVTPEVVRDFNPTWEQRIRLLEIERLLDDTGPTGPYRWERRKLMREKDRIWKRASGRDVNFIVTGDPTGKARPKKWQMAAYRRWKRIIAARDGERDQEILDLIEQEEE